jgi:uncharacterized delta-60 repeat protein
MTPRTPALALALATGCGASVSHAPAVIVVAAAPIAPPASAPPSAAPTQPPLPTPRGAPGTLDRSFGTAGVTVGPRAGSEARFQSLTRQPDGKIIGIGYGSAPDSASTDFVVARYDVDGHPDATFGEGGVAFVTFEGGAFGNGVAAAPDGAIVITGYGSKYGDSNVYVARLTANGALDPSFGRGGMVVTDLGSRDDRGEAALVTPDGAVVVVGIEATKRGFFPVVLRYTHAGTLDGAFGDGGIARFDFGPGRAFANRAALLPNGKIVFSGYTSVNAVGPYDLYAARCDATGRLDAAFGTAGVAQTSVGDADIGWALAVGADGRIVVGGSTSKPHGSDDAALVRYDADGHLDPTFGDGGKVTLDLGEDEQLYGLAIQANGSISGGGLRMPHGTVDATVLALRVTSAGALDKAFAGRGWTTFRFDKERGHTGAYTAIGDAYDRLVVAGEATSNDGVGRLAIARLWL